MKQNWARLAERGKECDLDQPAFYVYLVFSPFAVLPFFFCFCFLLFSFVGIQLLGISVTFLIYANIERKHNI